MSTIQTKQTSVSEHNSNFRYQTVCSLPDNLESESDWKIQNRFIRQMDVFCTHHDLYACMINYLYGDVHTDGALPYCTRVGLQDTELHPVLKAN